MRWQSIINNKNIDKIYSQYKTLTENSKNLEKEKLKLKIKKLEIKREIIELKIKKQSLLEGDNNNGKKNKIEPGRTIGLKTKENIYLT